MKILEYAAITLAMSQSTFAFAEAETESSLKSPYFIDGIHCEGLDGDIDDKKLSQGYSDDETAKVSIKIFKQKTCESIFASYGVEKFQWVTPEDLENLAFSLRQSQKFRIAEIKIEKSQMQNHVHLVGKFSAYERQTKVKISATAALDKGGASGDRTTTKMIADVGFGQRGPRNPAPISLGIVGFKSIARSPLSSDELKVDGKDVVMTENEKISQSRQNGSYQSFALTTQLPATLLLDIYFRVALQQSRLSLDETSTHDSRFEYGGEFRPPLTDSIMRAAIFYNTYTSIGSEVTLPSSKGENKEKSIFFASFSGEAHTKSFDVSYSFNRSLSSDLHYFINENIEWHAYENDWFKTSLGANIAALRGGILPELRFGLPDRSELLAYGKIERGFRLFNADQNVHMKLGWGSETAKSAEKDPYFRQQAAGELGYTTKTENFDVGIAFIYGNRRLY